MIVENGLGAYLCTRAHLDEYYNFLTNLCFITTWNIFDAVDHSRFVSHKRHCNQNLESLSILLIYSPTLTVTIFHNC